MTFVLGIKIGFFAGAAFVGLVHGCCAIHKAVRASWGDLRL